MAILFCDSGGNHYATAGIGTKWTTVTDVAAGANEVVSTGRFARDCLALTRGTVSQSSLTKTLASSYSSLVVGFAFRFATQPTGDTQLLQILDGGTVQCSLQHRADGTLRVVRSTSTALTDGAGATALSPNRWYYIEFKVTVANSIGAGTCVTRINGSTEITVATGQDVQATANATANQIRFTGPSTSGTGSGTALNIQDIYVTDGTSFLGDVTYDVLLPSGAGNSTQWTPSAGSNYECVDDATPDDDTTYVSSDTADEVDLYAYGDLSGSPTTIHAVQICTLARKDDAGTVTVAPVTRSGTTDYDGGSVNLGDSYAYDLQVRETDPDTSSAWAESGINAAQFGVKLVAT